MYQLPVTRQSYYKCIIFHFICVAGPDPVADPVAQFMLDQGTDDTLAVIRMDLLGKLRISVPPGSSPSVFLKKCFIPAMTAVVMHDHHAVVHRKPCHHLGIALLMLRHAVKKLDRAEGVFGQIMIGLDRPLAAHHDRHLNSIRT